MKGDELYEYIDLIKMKLSDRAQTIIEEIRENGTSQSTDKISRSVHSIVVSIKQKVQAEFSCG